MTDELLVLLEPRLSPLLAGWGFQPAPLKLAAKATSFMGIKRGGLGYGRDAADGSTEFLYFQKGSDRLAVAGFAGWAPARQIPAPQHAFDFPSPEGSERGSAAFVFPLFTLWGAQGKRLNAERLEGDEWLLAPAGPIPAGGDDAALAAGITAQLQARLRSESLARSPELPAAVEALAARMAGDIQGALLPYLGGRARAGR